MSYIWMITLDFNKTAAHWLGYILYNFDSSIISTCSAIVSHSYASKLWMNCKWYTANDYYNYTVQETP